MDKRYIIVMFCFLGALLLLPGTQAMAQNNRVTIESVVTDEDGNPIAGALVYGNEGSVVVKTDESGRFSIAVPSSNRNLLVESDGYESAVFGPGDQIQLLASPFQFGERD